MPDPVTGVSAGASLLGGYLSSSGQKEAANTQAGSAREAALIQAAAAEQALRLQKQLADEQVLRNAPTVQAGDTARNRMLDLIGLSGRTGAAGYGSANQPFSMAGFDPNSLMRNFSAADLEADVIRQDALRNANRMTDRSLASRGLFLSPQRATAEMANRLNTGEGALRRFQENRASQAGLFADAYNRDRTRQMDEYGRLSDFTTRGANAAANTGTSQAAYGTNFANLTSAGAQAMGQGVIGAGQATAAGQMGAGNTYNNAIDAALRYNQNNQMMNLFRQSSYAPQQAAYAPQQNAPYDPYSRFGYGTNA
jgi:hypothetical protein